MFGRERNQGSFLKEEVPEQLGRGEDVLSAGWLRRDTRQYGGGAPPLKWGKVMASCA